MAELSPLIGLKAHGTALSFVPPKNICYSRRTRKALTALHRTKEIDLYFRGVAAFRSNQRGSSSNYENPVAVVDENIMMLHLYEHSATFRNLETTFETFY